MKDLIALILISFSITAHADGWGDEWRTEDTVRQAVMVGLQVMDWGQTLNIAEECENGTYYEKNPILGPCPSKAEVNRYFMSYILVNYGVARILPQKIRPIFQYSYIVYQVDTVSSNYEIGLKIKF